MPPGAVQVRISCLSAADDEVLEDRRPPGRSSARRPGRVGDPDAPRRRQRLPGCGRSSRPCRRCPGAGRCSAARACRGPSRERQDDHVEVGPDHRVGVREPVGEQRDPRRRRARSIWAESWSVCAGAEAAAAGLGERLAGPPSSGRRGTSSRAGSGRSPAPRRSIRPVRGRSAATADGATLGATARDGASGVGVGRGAAGAGRGRRGGRRCGRSAGGEDGRREQARARGCGGAGVRSDEREAWATSGSRAAPTRHRPGSRPTRRTGP